MNSKTITQSYTDYQDMNVLQRANGDIYCPLCANWHQNNTWCQYTADEAMEG